MGLVKSNVVVLLGSAAMTVLAGVPQVAAQDQNSKFVTLLERLVIGAGAPKVAIDTPQAVTVINQEDIDSTQATTTGDIFTSVPGIDVVGSDRLFGEAFNIRGIGATENSADAARIIVTVDGAPKFNEQYRMGSFFSDPELYKQVEVLRGPASSTLYGAGAIGGVINFVTKDASDFIKDGKTGAVRVKTGYDSNGNGTLVSGLLAQHLNETFDILATGNFRRSDVMQFATGADITGSDFAAWSGLVKGTARFGDRDEQVLRLSYQRWQSNANDQDYAQTSTMDPIASGFGTIDRVVTDQTAVLSYENPASDNPWVDFKASLSYSDTRNEQSNSTSPMVPVIPMSPSLRILQDTDYEYRTWQLKAENTAEYVADDIANYFTFGLQASNQDRIAEVPAGGLVLPAHPEGNEKKLGLFGQNEFVWNDQLTLIAGARADFNWITPSSAIPGATDTQAVAFSPKIAALYNFNDNFGIFGSLAHTERMPTIDELYSYAPPDPFGAPLGKGMSLDLQKEEANNIEGGFTIAAYDLVQDGDSFTVKTTGFYNDLTNLIQSNPDGSATYYSNVASAHIYGVEVEAAYNSDYAFANVAYTATNGVDESTGNPLTSIPAHRLVATLGARLPEQGLELGVRAKFVANAENGVTATKTTPVVASDGYQTYDVFASWKPTSGLLEGTTAQFSIENIFNADYRDNLSVDSSKGRTFKLTLAKQFDY